MTHLHCSNLFGLWGYLTSQKATVKGYRVTFVDPETTALKWLKGMMGKVVITQLLGRDYADNIALIAKRK